MKETVAEPSPRVAVTPVGTDGSIAVETTAVRIDGALVPLPLVAVTVKVYSWPAIRSDTRAEVVVDSTDGPESPSSAVTVYEVTAEPLPSAASKLTSTLVSSY